MTVRIIAFRPVYNTLFNNPGKSILLSQLQYLDDRKSLQRWGETWFVRTSEGLAEEIGYHSAKSIGNWLREFSEMGIIKVRRAFLQGINQLWIQLNHEKIKELLEASGADLSLLDDNKPSPIDDKLPENKVPEAEVSRDSNSPQAKFIDASNILDMEVSDQSKVPEAEVSDQSKVPEAEVSGGVSSLSGNPIPKSIDLNKSDQDQKDQIKRSDDDFIHEHLSESQIAEVTDRVDKRFEALQFSDDPIRYKTNYLKKALRKEAEKVAAANKAEEVRRKEFDGYALNTSTLEPQTIEELFKNRDVLGLPVWTLPSDDIWDTTVEKIKARWDQMNFDVWIKSARFVEKNDNEYVIGVPNSSIADMLQYRLCRDVKSALCETAGHDLEIRYVVRSELRHAS